MWYHVFPGALPAAAEPMGEPTRLDKDLQYLSYVCTCTNVLLRQWGLYSPPRLCCGPCCAQIPDVRRNLAILKVPLPALWHAVLVGGFRDQKPQLAHLPCLTELLHQSGTVLGPPVPEPGLHFFNWEVILLGQRNQVLLENRSGKQDLAFLMLSAPMWVEEATSTLWACVSLKTTLLWKKIRSAVFAVVSSQIILDILKLQSSNM